MVSPIPFAKRSSFVLFVLALGWPALAKVNVVTTTTDLAAIAREIGGDLATVDAIAVGHQDPHFVDAKPSFLVKLRKADLFVEVGLELEVGWAPNLLLNARNTAVQKGNPGNVDGSAGIAPLQIPTAADRTSGDIHPFGNPHYWLDPSNGKIIARNIAEGFKRVDAANAAAYDKNLADFDARLDAAIARWQTEAAPLRGLPIVAYHDSWPYFEKRFGFDVRAFVEPKPGIPPSGRYITDLVAQMKKEGIGIIVMAPYYNGKTGELVARESGAKLVTLATSVGGVEGADDYFELFDTNLRLLLAAVPKS